MEFLKIEFFPRYIIGARERLEVTHLCDIFFKKSTWGGGITELSICAALDDGGSKAMFVQSVCISEQVANHSFHESFRITLNKLYHGRGENYDGNCGRQLFRDSFSTNFT